MFVLRKITSDNLEINIYLGSSYNFTDSERNKDEFVNICNVYFGAVDLHDADCYAFITDEVGEFHPLYKKQRNYIRTGKGDTFANVSFR